MRYSEASSAPPPKQKQNNCIQCARFYTTTTPTTLTAWIVAKLAKLFWFSMKWQCCVYHQKIHDNLLQSLHRGYKPGDCSKIIIEDIMIMKQRKRYLKNDFLLATHVAALAKGRNLQLNHGGWGMPEIAYSFIVSKILKTFHPWQWSFFLGWLPRKIKVHHLSSLNEATFS